MHLEGFFFFSWLNICSYNISIFLHEVLTSWLLFCFRAVVDHSVGKDLPTVSVESFEYLPGRGLIATLNSSEVIHY